MAEYDLGTARGRIEIDSSGAEVGAARAGAATKKLTSDLDTASGHMVRTGAVLTGVGVAAVAGFGVAVNAAANFEQRISAIGAVTGESGAALDRFRELALKLGADTKYSAGEAASAIEELAKAGISLPDILNGAAEAVTSLAAAGEVDLVRAAEITANSMNLFSISGDKASHVADVFAQAASQSSAGVEDLGLALNQVGGVAKLVGLSFEDTINALSQMADAGYKGSDAGTSVKTMLLSLQPSTLRQRELFDELGITTEGMGNRFFDAQGKLKPLIEIQKVLQDVTKGMTDAQRTATLEQIGGTDAIRALGVFTTGATEATEKYNQTLSKEGAAQEAAAKRLDNLKGSMEQFKGSVETALIRIGQLGQGPVRSVVDFLTRMVNGFGNLSKETQQWIIGGILAVGVLIGMLGAFVLTVGAIMKVVVAFRQFKAALEVIKGLQLLTKAMTALNASFLANPVFLIIAGLVLLAAGLYLLYKRSETFRKAVDAVWQAAQRAFDYILNAGKAVVDFFVNNWKLIIGVLFPFIGIPMLIIANWSKIVGFFKSLPGIIGGFLLMLVTKAIEFGVNFFQAVVGFLVQLPGKFVEAFAFIVGFMVGFTVRMILMAMEFGYNFIEAVLRFLITLPGKLQDIFISIIVAVASWVVDMLGKAVDLGSRFLNAIVEFFTQLPGRIWDFLTAAATNTANWVVDMVGKAVDLGTRFFNAIVDWFQQLPGRIRDFLVDASIAIANWVTESIDKALQMGRDFFNGVINGIEGMPGAVGRILDRVIDAIKGVIGRAFDAVKGFASAMWNGFKAGLGIGSPSLIEYAMWDLVDNVTDSAKDLKGQLLKVQKMAQVNFGQFGPTVAGQQASAIAASAGQAASGITSAANAGVAGVREAVTTFHNTFNTNADPVEISQQIMWDQRVRVRGAS